MIDFSITKKLGTFKLDVSAVLGDGLTGIFGESGSGKTTLLSCLNGFISPDKGYITMNGQTHYSHKDKINIPIERRKISMVFQDALLFPHMSVKENIYYGRAETTKQKQVKEIIDILKLYKFMNRKPSALSGGERQRVALARTLVHKPDLILMDEPVCSLDLKTRYQVLAYIKKIHQSLAVPVVYVSHSISELLFLVDHVYVLQGGRKQEDGTPSNILLKKTVDWDKAEDDIENVYDLPVLEKSKGGQTLLNFGENPLSVSVTLDDIRPRVKVGIRANDIIIANKKVGGLSARNIIPAQLEQITSNRDIYYVKVRVGQYTCLVEVTRQACEGLGLKEGQKIYLIMKSRSFIVLD